MQTTVLTVVRFLVFMLSVFGVVVEEDTVQTVALTVTGIVSGILLLVPVVKNVISQLSNKPS